METASRMTFLADAAARQQENYVTISIRELLAYWDAKRRGYWIVDEIQRDLQQAGLTTNPSFAEGWIDNIVTLVPINSSEIKENTTGIGTLDVVDATDRSLPQVALRVGSLYSANSGLTSVSPQDDLETAQSLMMHLDYSQLGVLSGPRTLRGAVSWESIAQARIYNPAATLKDATKPAEIVRISDDLLTQVPKIMDAGFAFVQGVDMKVTGIVTTADLSNQFVTLAKPFFMLAEVERRLRRVVNRCFSQDELKSIVAPENLDRRVESADDLTLGEYGRLLENPEHWSRLRWALDRKVFIEALNQIRITRNEVMHFSPDPLDDRQVKEIENFLKWIRKLDPDP